MVSRMGAEREMARPYFVRQASSGRRVVFESDVKTAWPKAFELYPDQAPTRIEGFQFESEEAAVAFDLDHLDTCHDDYFATWDDALDWMRGR